MVLFRRLVALVVFVLAVSCSDKSQSPSPQTQEQTPNPTTPTTSTPPNSSESAPSNSTTTILNNEKYLDPYTATLIQEIKNQDANDPESHSRKTTNIEFANQIFQVNYVANERRPKLQIITHTEKVYNFTLESKKGNIQHLTSFEPKSYFSNSDSEIKLYTAEIKTIKYYKNNFISIIQIKDLKTNGVVHVLYANKKGKLTTIKFSNYDYVGERTKTSRIFMERLLEDNSVEGEFYNVITEEDNASNATQFSITVANNFVMSSKPLLNYYRDEQFRSIPLVVDYKSFWKVLCGRICDGGISYKVITDPSYAIESSRYPIELSALNIDLQIEALEKVPGKKNTLPLRFFIKF